MAKRKSMIVPREQDMRKARKCHACNGSGYYDNTDEKGHVPKCGACGGSGYDERAR